MPSEVSILRKELHNVHKELHNVRKENMQLREAFKTIYEESSKAITYQTGKYHDLHHWPFVMPRPPESGQIKCRMGVKNRITSGNGHVPFFFTITTHARARTAIIGSAFNSAPHPSPRLLASRKQEQWLHSPSDCTCQKHRNYCAGGGHSLWLVEKLLIIWFRIM